MEDISLNIHIRHAIDQDVNFIYHSWLKSFRKSDFARPITDTVYFPEHHKLIENICVKDSTEMLVACNQDEPDQIYGYIVGELMEGIPCVHYIYVKHTFRGLGIGTRLLQCLKPNLGTGSVHTHHTGAANKLGNRFNSVYQPYVLIHKYKESNDV